MGRGVRCLMGGQVRGRGSLEALVVLGVLGMPLRAQQLKTQLASFGRALLEATRQAAQQEVEQVVAHAEAGVAGRSIPHHSGSSSWPSALGCVMRIRPHGRSVSGKS